MNKNSKKFICYCNVVIGSHLIGFHFCKVSNVDFFITFTKSRTSLGAKVVIGLLFFDSCHFLVGLWELFPCS